MKRGVPLAAAAVALLAAGFGLGALLTGEDENRLRVNGSEIVRNVWEALPGQGKQPPQCSPLTGDGIGEWSCIVDIPVARPPGKVKVPGYRPNAFHGELVIVTVQESGKITGQMQNIGQRFSACCVQVRD